MWGWWGGWRRLREFTVASLKPSSSSDEQTLKPDLPASFIFLSLPPSSTLPSLFPSLFRPTVDGPISASLPPHGPGPHAALSLPPPMFANHFFPCQQVNCFVLPFPAFITLCKLSDMSSTGARLSTHRANAKIMRFGIINEDKLAVAVLLSARARLHYSLNLPVKMT